MTKNNVGENIRLYIEHWLDCISIVGIVQVTPICVLFAGFFWIWLTDTIDILKRK